MKKRLERDRIRCNEISSEAVVTGAQVTEDDGLDTGDQVMEMEKEK